MASIYKQKTSAYWWINYRNPRTGKIVRESTGFHHTIPAETRKAQELEAIKTLGERQAPATVAGKWGLWVETYIRKQVKSRTAERYLTAWRTLRIFLDEHHIISPRDVTYENCSSYLDWRETPNHKSGKYKAGKNTAILEFKLLRWLLREAVKRGYCSSNPAREVVVKRAPRKIFPDYTDEQLQTIQTAFAKEPEAERICFQRSFAVALFQGVRLNETNVNPLRDVHLAAEIPTIRFLQKGGKDRIKPLHPQLIPLFRKLQTEKATETYTIKRNAAGRMMWGNRWTKFFIRHGIKDGNPNACFHSLRVTVENVLREAGIAKEIREAYLSHEHGNKDVNASYDRVKLRELRACHEPLNRSWLVV